jgi:hypothetical protein
MSLTGEAPDRSLHPHVDWYNGWIFILGKARYNPDFWASYDYPSYPGERSLEKQLSENRPLETQFVEFRNNQFYLLPILRRRHGLREGYWDRTGLYQDKSEF